MVVLSCKEVQSMDNDNVISMDPGSELDPGMGVYPSLLTTIINFFERLIEKIKALFSSVVQPR